MPDITKTGPCICMQVRKLGRQLTQIYDQCLRPAGIRSAQYGLLRHVEALPEPSISDIGRALSMDQTTVTRNVEKLEKKALVTTRPHPDDPRKKIVELAPAGRATLAEARPLWEEAQRRVQAGLGPDTLADLLRLLREATTTKKQ